jgi:hypothetical protein
VGELDRVRELAGQDHGLAVVVTQRKDGSPQTSVVNAAVVDHPVTYESMVGFLMRGETLKHRHLRRQPRVTVVFRVGLEWTAVEGHAECQRCSLQRYQVRPTRFAHSLRADLHGTGVGVSLVLPGPIRDAGMWADTGVTLPRGTGTRSLNR